MFERKIIPLAVAAVVLLGTAGAVFARDENDDQQEAAAVQSATISLAQAVDAAQKHTGGYAIAAGMEKTKGGYRYEVRTVAKQHVTQNVIDSSTGAVITTEHEGAIARLFDREHRAELGKLQSAKTTLSSAIAAVEQHSGGKAFEAAFENENAKTGFEVDVTKDGGTQKFLVDAATGNIETLAASDHDEQRGQHDEEHED